MSNRHPDLPQRQTAQSALRVLEVFSSSAGVAFDRMVADRVLGETEQAIVYVLARGNLSLEEKDALVQQAAGLGCEHHSIGL